MNKRVAIGGAVIGLVVIVAAVWFVFFRDDAPEAVSTEAGLEQLTEDLDTDEGAEQDAVTDDGSEQDAVTDEGAELDAVTDDGSEQDAVTDDESDAPVDGTWTVDDDFGDFDFETASGSFAGFRVAEELTIGETTAVGRSGGITGSLTIEDGVLTAAEITVDMTTIVSNDSRREGAIRRAVGATDFPTAAFVLTEPVTLDVAALEAGDTVAVDAAGDLTVKGTTNPVSFALEATIAEPGVGLVIGSTEIVWDDFGVTAPSAPIVVSVADEGTVELQLVIRQG